MRDQTELAWEVEWAKHSKASQSAAAMTPFAKTMASLPPTVESALVLQGGGGEKPRTWLVARATSEDEATMVKKVFSGLAPWIGLSTDPIQIAPTPNGAVLRATVERRDARGEALARESVFVSVAASSETRWQLVLRPGPESSEGDGYHIGMALVGQGMELSTAGPLLELDGAVARSSLDISLEPDHHAVTPDEDTSPFDLARYGGTLPLPSIGKLLSIPLRINEAWPIANRKPDSPERVLSAVRDAVTPHVQVLGATGSGKSQLLAHFEHRAHDDGAAIVAVDTSGDLPELTCAVAALRGFDADVVDFGGDPTPRWNINQPDHGIDVAEHAQLIVKAMGELWRNPEWTGPVWHQTFGWAVDLLCNDEKGPWPLTRLPELFDEPSRLRDELLKRADERLRRTYRSQIARVISDKDSGNTISWIVGKIQPFLSDPTVRRIIDSKQSTLDLRRVTQGHSLIVNIPQSSLTPHGARLLGGILVGRLWLLIKRFGTERPIHLFLDEWQNLAIPEIGEILAEGRKRGLKIFLANQNAAQVPTALWESAMANTGTIISFRTGPKDAALIEPRYPTIHPGPIARLRRHWVAVSTGDEDFIAPAPHPLDLGDGKTEMARMHKQTMARNSSQQVVDLTDTPEPGTKGRPGRNPEPNDDDALDDPAAWLASLVDDTDKEPEDDTQLPIPF